MNHPVTERAQDQQPRAAITGRHDMYARVHKALRLCMSRTLTQAGSTDPDSDAEVTEMLDAVERLLSICESHLEHEDAFVHPALERAVPGSADRVRSEHAHHLEAISDLRDLAGLVADNRDAARAAACARLYRALALFVAENFQHMHFEETVHNSLLWHHYSDEELLALEHDLVAAIPPEQKFELLNWFIPALNGPERIVMLAGMREGMPPEPFRAVLALAERHLTQPQYAALAKGLGVPAAPGLTTA